MPEPRRLFIHLGLQKTGTSYLQGVLHANADLLASQGLDLLPPTRRETFELMLLVRDRYHAGRDPDSVRDALDRFSRLLAEAPGRSALLSQESLAAARPPQVRRLLDACGDREVHVVLTVRDLARQLPSSWQQELKAGRDDDYAGYLRRLQESQLAGRGGHPWIHLDPPAVLARWAEYVPAERIHVVTVPPSGSAPTLLLERFCTVLGVDAGSLVPEETPSNTSLGRVQAELLRRVNEQLPGELREWCRAVAGEQIRDLAAAGYRVEGTLEDLRCPEAAFADDEAEPAEREVAAVAVAALVRILTLRASALQRRREAPPAGPGLRTRARRLLRRRPHHGTEQPASGTA